jgi:hypothetical protein
MLLLIIETDASLYAYGAVLLQPHPRISDITKSVLHSMAYMSHKLTQTQQRYAAQERELLAIILAL